MVYTAPKSVKVIESERMGVEPRIQVWRNEAPCEWHQQVNDYHVDGRQRSLLPVERRHHCRRLTPASVAARHVICKSIAGHDLWPSDRLLAVVAAKCRPLPAYLAGLVDRVALSLGLHPLDWLGLLTAPGRFNYRTSCVLSHRRASY